MDKCSHCIFTDLYETYTRKPDMRIILISYHLGGMGMFAYPRTTNFDKLASNRKEEYWIHTFDKLTFFCSCYKGGN